ncbi:MAG: CatA-like O-acetyltransferase [Bacteroidota bacterium]
MKKVVFQDPHRKKHFEFFKNMDQPHYSFTIPIDIGPFLKYIKGVEAAFTPTMVYAVSYCANKTQNFRRRIRAGEVVEHEIINPSFTVLTQASSVFSFCYVDYHSNANKFIASTVKAIEDRQKDPSFENVIGRDDFLFISILPWFTFYHINHPMHYHPVDSIPRFAWGKYEKKGEEVIMPLSIQAHHALVDGIDIGKYVNLFQSIMQEPEQLQLG